MAVVILALAVLAVAAGAYFGLGVVRRRPRFSELRGDWWTPFEREFRAYVSRTQGSARDGRHHRQERGSTSR